MARHLARVTLWILLLVLGLFPVRAASAGLPSDQLRDGVERVFRVLRDPELKGEKKVDERTAAVAKAASEIFDFGETAKRSLGQHWEQRTPTERTEFVRLFTELIERSYISKVDKYTHQKMTVLAENVDGEYAVVRTRLLLNHGDEMPLDYKMRNTGSRWQVYDISIDGISLVANYRAQFNKVIRTSSYETLVTRLKSNQAEFSPPPGGPSRGNAAR